VIPSRKAPPNVAKETDKRFKHKVTATGECSNHRLYGVHAYSVHIGRVVFNCGLRCGVVERHLKVQQTFCRFWAASPERARSVYLWLL